MRCKSITKKGVRCLNKARLNERCFKHTPKYCIDSSQKIPEHVLKKLKGMTLPAHKGRWLCGVDYTDGKGMAAYFSIDKKGVLQLEKVVEI